MYELLTKALQTKILPAVVFDNERHVLPVAEIFLSKGLKVIEVPLRTNIALKAINIIRKNFAEMYIGAGTILNINLLQQAINAGAQFGLSSSLNTTICNEAKQLKFPFIPGVMTPSEIELAYVLGYSIQKLFPAAQLGGKYFLKAMLGPYEQFNLQFIPMGGVNVLNMSDYLKLKNVIAVGGTWLATKETMEKEDYKAIEANIMQALQCINQ